MVYILAINVVGYGEIVEEHTYKTFEKAKQKATEHSNKRGNGFQYRIYKKTADTKTLILTL